MNIIDALIIIIILISIVSGFRRGFIKEIVLLIGLVLILVISFKLRVPISTFMYKNLPFFGTSGIFSKISALNILLFELIAFLIMFGLLYAVLRILLVVSGIIEKILKVTIILGFFSKIGGIILGFIEGYIITFIILFILNQPFFNISELDKSKFGNFILDNTPVLSSSVKNLRNVSDEIVKIYNLYKDGENKDFNKETIDLFIKYNIISEENVEYLKEKGKIK